MSKMNKLVAAALMMSAIAGQCGYVFDTGCDDNHRNPYEGETDEERKRRLHKMFGENTQEHEFVINGERIMAKNRKTALKIYERLHPMKKKRKKK